MPDVCPRTVSIVYRNYRGEISIRTILPDYIQLGSTEHHPEPQWLLWAWDYGKDAVRTFAVKDILS